MPNCPHCHEYLEYLNYHRTIVEDGKTWEGTAHTHDAVKEDIEHEEYTCPFCSAHIADTPEDAQKFLRSD